MFPHPDAPIGGGVEPVWIDPGKHLAISVKWILEIMRFFFYAFDFDTLMQ